MFGHAAGSKDFLLFRQLDTVSKMTPQQQATSWVALESNPEVMNQFIHSLGVSRAWEFCDIYGLDEELLSMVPPSCAVILLFPITEKYEEFRRQEEATLQSAGQSVSPSAWFIRQTIGNACGTIAVLHALANNSDRLHIDPESALARLLAQTRSMTPTERAAWLSTSKDLAAAHAHVAEQGQTAAPSADADIDLHFVCFAAVDGTLYEFDGRKSAPIDHGPCTELLPSVAKVAREFMARDPDNVQFTLMALAEAQQ
ncbi:ubiquitinyl hydrolase 1 [Sorochytrium milnesiophthora]